jgi:hypothetical protein
MDISQPESSQFEPHSITPARVAALQPLVLASVPETPQQGVLVLSCCNSRDRRSETIAEQVTSQSIQPQTVADEPYKHNHRMTNASFCKRLDHPMVTAVSRYVVEDNCRSCCFFWERLET